ncbi:hypothetical protein HGM15179_019820, partial [Zosterops borbonicus]
MLTLPRKPRPTLQDYIEVVTEVAPLMTSAKPEKPEPKRRTVATAETDNATPAPKTPRSSRPWRQPSKGRSDR